MDLGGISSDALPRRGAPHFGPQRLQFLKRHEQSPPAMAADTAQQTIELRYIAFA